MRRSAFLVTGLAALFLCHSFTAYSDDDDEDDLSEESTREERKRYDDVFYRGDGTKVVFDKFYEKNFASELMANGSILPFGSITFSFGGGGAYAFHFNDAWAWEVVHAQIFHSSLTAFAESELSRITINKLKATYMTSVLWNGLYGKMRLLGTKILRHDIYGILGLGAAGTDDGMKFALGFGLGLRVFTGKHFTVRVEFRDTFYPEKVAGKDQIKNNFMINIGSSFFIPGFEHTEEE